MNREQARTLLSNINVVKAFADGLDVQYRHEQYTQGKWKDMVGPNFTHSDTEYRIKPEPIEKWMVITPNGLTLWVYPSKEDAERHIKNTRIGKIVHMREVI